MAICNETICLLLIYKDLLILYTHTKKRRNSQVRVLKFLEKKDLFFEFTEKKKRVILLRIRRRESRVSKVKKKKNFLISYLRHQHPASAAVAASLYQIR